MTASRLSKRPKGQAVSPAPSPISSGTSLFPRGDQPSPAQPRLLSCDTFLQLPPVLMETYGNFSPPSAPPPPSLPSWGDSAVTALDGSRHPSKGPSHLCWAHSGTGKGPTTNSSPLYTLAVGWGNVLPTPPSPITSPQTPWSSVFWFCSELQTLPSGPCVTLDKSLNQYQCRFPYLQYELYRSNSEL